MLPRTETLSDGDIDAFLVAASQVEALHDAALTPHKGAELVLVKTVNVGHPVESAVQEAAQYWPILDACRPVVSYLAAREPVAYSVVAWRLWRSPPLPWREVAERAGLSSHSAAMEAMHRARYVVRMMVPPGTARAVVRWVRRKAEERVS
ncbi:MAG: hypothetical protein AB1760_00385 [Pseudomonadota bacterium]